MPHGLSQSANSSSHVTVLVAMRFGNGGSDRLKSKPRPRSQEVVEPGLPSGPGQRDSDVGASPAPQAGKSLYQSAWSSAVCLAQSRPPGTAHGSTDPRPSASGSPSPLGWEEHSSQSAAPTFLGH